MDCTNDKKLANRYEIKGYPTILFFDESSATRSSGTVNATVTSPAVTVADNHRSFRGFRSAGGFHDYVTRMARNPVVEAQSDWAALLSAVEQQKLAAFIHVTKHASDPIDEQFAEFAEKHRDLHDFYSAPAGPLPPMSTPGSYILTSKYHTHQIEIRKYEDSKNNTKMRSNDSFLNVKFSNLNINEFLDRLLKLNAHFGQARLRGSHSVTGCWRIGSLVCGACSTTIFSISRTV